MSWCENKLCKACWMLLLQSHLSSQSEQLMQPWLGKKREATFSCLKKSTLSYFTLLLFHSILVLLIQSSYVHTSERPSRRRATYWFVQGEAQAAVFVQHKESPLPFLSERRRQCSLKFTQCAFHQMKQFIGRFSKSSGSVCAQRLLIKGIVCLRFIFQQFTTQSPCQWALWWLIHAANLWSFMDSLLNGSLLWPI